MTELIGEKANLKSGPGQTINPSSGGGSVQAIGEKANLSSQPSGVQGLGNRNTRGGSIQEIGEMAKLSGNMRGNHGYQGTVLSKRTSARSK